MNDNVEETNENELYDFEQDKEVFHKLNNDKNIDLKPVILNNQYTKINSIDNDQRNILSTKKFLTVPDGMYAFQFSVILLANDFFFSFFNTRTL